MENHPVGTPPSPADFEAIAGANAALYRSCFAATGDLMARLSAMDTADDIGLLQTLIFGK
jgi:hypothetical protein